MNPRIFIPPPTSCLWLIAPILIGNMLFAAQLPFAFQAGMFWHDIPAAITLPENLLRVLMFTAFAFMPMRKTSQMPRVGWVLFLSGAALYSAAWALLIFAPLSGLAQSAVGFLAPAYTPTLWLLGIALIGGKPLFWKTRPDLAWRLIILVLIVGFLAAHIAHTALIFSRVF